MTKKAFTLTELIVITALLSIMTVVIAVVFLTGLKAWSSGLNRTGIREEGSIAMERMMRDLSQASNITAATAATITFTADVDNDSVNETVTFSRDVDNNLIRTVDGSAITLTPNAQALAFSYTDLNNTSIVPASQADRDTIRVVTMALTMSKSGETYTLSSSAYTRNQALP